MTNYDHRGERLLERMTSVRKIIPIGNKALFHGETVVMSETFENLAVDGLLRLSQ